MEKTIENILPLILLFVTGGIFFSYDLLVNGIFKNEKIRRLLCLLMLLCFVGAFLSITLAHRSSVLPRKIWIIPFYSYYKFISGWQVYLFVQGIQNILLFIPLGFFGSLLLEQYVQKRRRIVVISCGLLLSLTVELTQYIRAVGILEIDDIIHNTFGTVWGYLLYETICSLRIIKNQNKVHLCVVGERLQFTKYLKIISGTIVLYLIIILAAYLNHLYHVHVLWK